MCRFLPHSRGTLGAPGDLRLRSPRRSAWLGLTLVGGEMELRRASARLYSRRLTCPAGSGCVTAPKTFRDALSDRLDMPITIAVVLFH
jgi:hypothetical protein